MSFAPHSLDFNVVKKFVIVSFLHSQGGLFGGN